MAEPTSHAGSLRWFAATRQVAPESRTSRLHTPAHRARARVLPAAGGSDVSFV